MIDTIHCCSVEYPSIVWIVINRYDQQSVVRQNQLLLWRTHVDRIGRYRSTWSTVSRSTQLLLWRTPVDCIDRYQSIQSTVCWSTLSTHAQKNLRRTYRSLSIDTINSQLTDTINNCSKGSRPSYNRYQSTRSTVIGSHQFNYRSKPKR